MLATWSVPVAAFAAPMHAAAVRHASAPRMVADPETMPPASVVTSDKTGVVVPTVMSVSSGVNSWYDAGVRLGAAAETAAPQAEADSGPKSVGGLLWSDNFDPAAKDAFVASGRAEPGAQTIVEAREVSWIPGGVGPDSIPDGPLGVGRALAKALDAQIVDEYLTLAPKYLDGKGWAGDIGFDPMCLACLASPTPDVLKQCTSAEARRSRMDAMSPAEQASALTWMRSSELKHGRLAMLAAAGWPLSELVAGGFLKPITNGRAPALFNGGLFDFPFAPFVALVFGGLAFLEVTTKESVTDGDYGFDPLGLAKESAKVDLSDLPSKLPEAVASFRTGPTATIGNSIPETLPNIGDLTALREVELKHGRAAMMGITGFAVQEALWGNPVVEQTPWFFGR